MHSSAPSEVEVNLGDELVRLTAMEIIHAANSTVISEEERASAFQKLIDEEKLKVVDDGYCRTLEWLNSPFANDISR